jgi:uncharacterized membrane protein YfcA
LRQALAPNAAIYRSAATKMRWYFRNLASMDLLSFLGEYSTITLVTLALLAFVAGFLDAVVGGGGLIQLPALLIQLPQTPVATLLGTNKIAALAGTSVAAVSYAKRIRFDYRLLALLSLMAFVSAFLGAKAVTYLDSNALKPLILIILVVMLVYTYVKKDLGHAPTKQLSPTKQAIYGSLLALLVGFYDGFFGPGTGSFFVLGFVLILGFEFIRASAYAKAINVVTNLSALIVFVSAGHFILPLAILMAICNMLGNVSGTRMAFKRGNGFVRIVFLVVVALMITRYAYDIFSW